MDNTDYLSRKAIVKNLTDGLKHYEGRVETLTYRIIERFMEYIKEFPAADVQPVKRGKWEYNDKPIFGNPYGRYCCSLCGSAMDSGEDNYCPCCGARMDGDTP